MIMNKTIYCVGDSLTAGKCSYNWVKKLNFKLKKDGFTVVNKGKDGETSTVLMQRLKWDIIEHEPDFIVIMIGGNDLIGSIHESMGPLYMKLFPEVQKKPPSIADYETNIEKIMEELDIRLPKKTSVVFLSPPPIGEGGPHSKEWKCGQDLSNIYKRLSQEASDRIYFLDLYDIVKKDMIKAGCNRPLVISLKRIWLTSVMSKFMTFNTLRWLNGFKYTNDGIHFCNEFGEICINLITEWILTFNNLTNDDSSPFL
tara:strand:- start:326 stop:1093 length:768 start_codon:yes stop_codon:yes gene_type:complete